MHDEAIEAGESGESGEASTLSRRALIGGLGVAGAVGAAGLIGFGSEHVASAQGFPEAIAAPIPGLVYLPLDAFAFDVGDTSSTLYRLYQDLTGMQPSVPNREIFASLPLPAGSVIRQINVSYQGQPILAVRRRALGSNALTTFATPLIPASSGGPASFTVVPEPLFTLTPGATYFLSAFCTAGTSILGVEVGYVPAAQAFIPFSGADARVLDTRAAGQTRFEANAERVIDLSSKLIATGRAAVVNVTATQTAGPGFLAAFSDGVAYPGNSTVNFTGANQTIANSAVCTMAGGKIKIKCGPAATHVLVDVIGTLL